jgi:lysozyme
MTIFELLKREEGFVPHVYQDHLGYWTIGYGRLVDKRRGGRIREGEAELMLKNDIEEVEAKLDEHIPWWRGLVRTRRTILTAMAYQMGIGGLMRFRNTLAAVKRGDYAEAARGMRASLWARQTPGRAERMAQAMERGRFR